MPANYAHITFGREVLTSLPAPIQNTIEEHFDAFALGVHGPDPLFYYHPLEKNEVNALGHKLHFEEAAPFFARAKEIFEMRGKRGEDKAYLYGYLCHFALDSTAHPLIAARLLREPKVTHEATESSFDRLLLEREGKDPLKEVLTQHIHPSKELAELSAAYYLIPPKRTKKAIKSILFYSGILRAPHMHKRKFLLFALRFVKKPHIGDMMIPFEKDERCKDIDQELTEAYNAALPKAKELIVSYENYLNGAGELSPLLNRNYE